jgi:hypothetical protein
LTPEDIVESQELQSGLLWVLGRFQGRRLDDALFEEITHAVNEELKSWRDGRRVRLWRDDGGIRVALEPEEDPERASIAA